MHAQDARVELGRIRFRRALALMVMTLVLPGSAQLVAGRKEVGRIAMRIWFGLILTGVCLLLLAVISKSFVFWFASNPFWLGLVRFGLMALAVGWAFLLVDAWRIGEPLALRQRQRLAMVGINGVLCFSVAGSLLFASHVVSVQKDFLAAMFSSGPASGSHDGRYNILLLGGDSGADRWGLRPDSITVASIDEQTGKTVLFGLPRNMLNFPFAKGSIMAEQFPRGYNCGTTCELNSLATWAADHKALFTGVQNPGVEATTEAVEGITGLKINYYAMVNLKGFQKMVDAVGGVTLNVRDRIPIGGVGGPVTGYIKPGKRKLNGFQTLWFARSRESADDYSRMARQKCVMNAMLQQLSPQKVVLKFEKIAKASEDLISTDVPLSEVDHFIDLALKARSQPVRTVSFVPPLVNTSHPDIAQIQEIVQTALKAKNATRAVSAGKAAKGTQSTGSTPPSGAPKQPASQGTTGGAIGSMHAGYAANQADDLGSAC
ncbi:LCP family protein [Nocardioides pocheonensis]|uniref:LytR family transcriptional regulator n=1 Tax=Nocardioides pocheonensis TaxID=661485 RepID=A0A3N0GM84_9ACTN|nr:LCP family protein [Nocardioides pocheonensis]RNM13573.1 LytR family transcriptional regulator [Nocardioides pocheonensis]